MTRHMARVGRVVLLLAAAVAPVGAQRGPLPDPAVRENVTVKVGPHTYAIPDGNVALVPNIGIVVGNRATLIIDTGLGRQNGEVVMREVAKVSRTTSCTSPAPTSTSSTRSATTRFPPPRST